MKKEGNRVTRSSRVSESNVLDDLWFSPEERAALKLKIDLHSEIMKIVEKRGLTPRELEKLLDQPQPRISELLRGKISNVSAEKLTGYLVLLGVSIVISPKKAV